MSQPLEKLYARILERRCSPPAESYTAKLLSEGIGKISKKVGEEAVETALAAVANDKFSTVAESADLLYHLLVLWAALGITPDDVYSALEKRAGRSGLQEKASRGNAKS